MVRRKGLIAIAAAVAICAGCKEEPKPPRLSPPVRKIRATVVTIQTTLQPANRTFTHSLVIADGRARSGDEVDGWRLFDLAKRQVIFVDDLKKSYRRVPFDEVFATRRAALNGPVPDGLPRVQFQSTSAIRTLQGVQARQSLVRVGGYQRQLWIAEHPAIPPELFAVMHASEPVTSPIASLAQAADEALMNVRGFPLNDHAELPFGNAKMVVDHTVVRIEQRDVPETWLNLRSDYTEIKPPPPAPKPAAVPTRRK